MDRNRHRHCRSVVIMLVSRLMNKLTEHIFEMELEMTMNSIQQIATEI